MSSYTSLKGIKYNIVLLHPEHVSQVVSIFERAPKTEMSAALWPPRLSNPDDPEENPRFRRKLLENRLKNPSTAPMLIAVSDNEDKKVLGFAGWSVPDLESLRQVMDLPRKEKENDLGTIEAANDAPKLKVEEEGDGTMSDGQGGKRGDGKKLPMGLDITLQSKIKQMVGDAKKEILGPDGGNVLCKASLNLSLLRTSLHVSHSSVRRANLSSQILGRLGPIQTSKDKASLLALFIGVWSGPKRSEYRCTWSRRQLQSVFIEDLDSRS